jgi:hypothetical protein
MLLQDLGPGSCSGRENVLSQKLSIAKPAWRTSIRISKAMQAKTGHIRRARTFLVQYVTLSHGFKFRNGIALPFSVRAKFAGHQLGHFRGRFDTGAGTEQ